jgi:putative acetyltransferase
MIHREAGDADAPTVRAILLESFPTPAEADLVDRLREDGDLVLALLAEEGEAPCGVAVLSPMEAPFPALGLGPVAVRPARRRHGIGAALVREALARAGAAGWRGVFVLGDPAWYARLGFSAEAAAGFDCAFAGPAFMACPLGGAALPARGGRLAYPPAFDGL